MILSVVLGLAFALTILALRTIFGEYALVIDAMALAVVAAVYPGALLVGNASRKTIVQEGLASIATFSLAVLGVIFAPILVAVGFLFHALWDWMKHSGGVGVKVVAWYPPACAVADLAIAGYLLFVATQ